MTDTRCLFLGKLIAITSHVKWNNKFHNIIGEKVFDYDFIVSVLMEILINVLTFFTPARLVTTLSSCLLQSY